MPKRTSGELKAGFEKLRKEPFFQIYTESLTGEFNRVLQALMQNANSDEKELRVYASVMSAFQTALNLPDLLIKQAETEEELEIGPYEQE